VRTEKKFTFTNVECKVFGRSQNGELKIENLETGDKKIVVSG